MRSVQQQKNMEVLEAEKDSLLKSNKAMKKDMWDWKQQLFAEAELPNPLIPLSKIKAIYGDVQTTTSTSGMTFFLFLSESQHLGSLGIAEISFTANDFVGLACLDLGINDLICTLLYQKWSLIRGIGLKEI